VKRLEGGKSLTTKRLRRGRRQVSGGKWRMSVLFRVWKKTVEKKKRPLKRGKKGMCFSYGQESKQGAIVYGRDGIMTNDSLLKGSKR